jgi:hypothetical protein
MPSHSQTRRRKSLVLVPGFFGLALGASVAACNANVSVPDFPLLDASVGGFDASGWSSSGGLSSSSGGVGSSSGGTAGDGGVALDASTVHTPDGGGADANILPTGDGGPEGFHCTEKTCEDGCCQNDVCVTSTATTCGTHGIACQNCSASSEVCSPSGQCGTSIASCSDLTCSDGCCSGDVCVVAISATSCGPVGVACIDCTATDQVCSTDGSECLSDAGAPPLVDAGDAESPQTDASACTSSCSGCCDSTGTCQAGSADTACGASGVACQDCAASGQTCLLQTLCD